MSFLALFISLPTKASTGRMRVWRSVKALGCATLRDGVYLLPDSADSAAALDEVAAQAVEVGGSGEVYRLSGCEEAQEAALRALFDRGEEYAGIAEEIKELGRSLTSLDGAAAARKLQPLVRRFEQVARIDFFPGEAQRQGNIIISGKMGYQPEILKYHADTPSESGQAASRHHHNIFTEQLKHAPAGALGQI